MITRLIAAVFAPKQPRRYTGRHRAPEAEPAPVPVHIVAVIPAQRVA